MNRAWNSASDLLGDDDPPLKRVRRIFRSEGSLKTHLEPLALDLRWSKIIPPFIDDMALNTPSIVITISPPGGSVEKLLDCLANNKCTTW